MQTDIDRHRGQTDRGRQTLRSDQKNRGRQTEIDRHRDKTDRGRHTLRSDRQRQKDTEIR